jgi:hypothetical protein
MRIRADVAALAVSLASVAVVVVGGFRVHRIEREIANRGAEHGAYVPVPRSDWEGSYTVRNRSGVEARVALAGRRCEDDVVRVGTGDVWTMGLRAGLPVTICAPGAVAEIVDVLDGAPRPPVIVKAERLSTVTTEGTMITLWDAKR